MTIDQTGSRIVASTVWGALHALETFSQCVDYTHAEGYAIHGTQLHIADVPRFGWRGMLVDTARHYLPPQHLMHVIDTLAYNKMNVLHWHIVDAQSFPIEIQVRCFRSFELTSPHRLPLNPFLTLFVSMCVYVCACVCLCVQAYPQLSQAGAYDPSAVFSQQDVQNVVQYGYERGTHTGTTLHLSVLHLLPFFSLITLFLSLMYVSCWSVCRRACDGGDRRSRPRVLVGLGHAADHSQLPVAGRQRQQHPTQPNTAPHDAGT